MHKESEYDLDESVDRVLELLRQINQKLARDNKRGGRA